MLSHVRHVTWVHWRQQRTVTECKYKELELNLSLSISSYFIHLVLYNSDGNIVLFTPIHSFETVLIFHVCCWLSVPISFDSLGQIASIDANICTRFFHLFADDTLPFLDLHIVFLSQRRALLLGIRWTKKDNHSISDLRLVHIIKVSSYRLVGGNSDISF